jgi:hypothetical protein
MNMDAAAAAWKFAPIQYIKKANPDGTQSPGYVFTLTEVPDDLTITVSDTATEHIVNHVKSAENGAYLSQVYAELLKAFSRNFTKSYTPAQCMRLTSHIIQIDSHNSLDADTYMCTLTPKSITLFGGRFTLQWNAALEPLGIEIALENDAADVETPVISSVAPVAASAIPSNSTESPQNTPATAHAALASQVIEVEDIESADDADSATPSLRSGPPVPSERQTRDRRRVEEFRLRATLAAVRAERALERYIEKYGEYDIESSDSATTDYTTGGESDI